MDNITHYVITFIFDLISPLKFSLHENTKPPFRLFRPPTIQDLRVPIISTSPVCKIFRMIENLYLKTLKNRWT